MPDGNESNKENPEELARQQKIYNMEKDCVNEIKTVEKNMKKELKQNRDDVEDKINSYKLTNNIKDALEHVLEKTLHDRAREKYKETLVRTDDDAGDEAYENDILAPFIEDRSKLKDILDENNAKKIKNEILKKFRERIVSRADIINKRITEEKTKLEDRIKEHERKIGDLNEDKKDDLKYSEEINELQKKTKILENRAHRFQIKALEKFQNLQKLINNDPRFAAIHRSD